MPGHKANEATKSPKGLKRRKGPKGRAVTKEKHFCPFGPSNSFLPLWPFLPFLPLQPPYYNKKRELQLLGALSLKKVAMTYSPTKAAQRAGYAVPAANSHAKHSQRLCRVGCEKTALQGEGLLTPIYAKRRVLLELVFS